MRTRRLDRPNLTGQLDVSRATGLVATIGAGDPNAFATELLKLFDDAQSVTQCTVSAHEFGNRPCTISVADHCGGRYLRDVADTYARHFYSLDGNQKVISTASRAPHRHDLLLHQQTGDEIGHEAYRAACYRGPEVSDRLSLLMEPNDATWLSINLYRAHGSGHFQPREIASIEYGMSPLNAAPDTFQGRPGTGGITLLDGYAPSIALHCPGGPAEPARRRHRVTNPPSGVRSFRLIARRAAS